ncbi:MULTISPECIES: LPS export ABC transporter periplasmic protein LptC [unclassified Acinetobacter]|uniref:LPS export ABC transporter periplasmic protein LptC n=1 Tax=unclassified Acinetobacter TaxID=196816 RepID=UPI002934F4A2|nr:MULTISPECIES: LPS export ABC transporter periplasmic protein LptC [unclassified Acinetobacter]WOE33081.1 LPS export ABC transporter periplasmic protein LptC [Acinetobacter sp. SAAs470]WOE39909.1 LPS export ABC transporter periplasmic protein LptC [Acinetobacter sp. SAAs474]
MDTKNLYIIALVVGSFSAGYYYYSGKSNKLEVDSARSMTYSAEKINLIQTNEQGQVSVKAQVDRLMQDDLKHTSQFDNLNAQTYENDKVDGTFYAKVAYGYDDNQRIVLSDQVIATRFLPSGKMILTTTELTGFPKTKEIETDKQVMIDSPQSKLISQGLKANLNSGQYELFSVRGTYEP